MCFRLFQVRGKLYELLINCIPPEIVLKVKVVFEVSFSFSPPPQVEVWFINLLLSQRLLYELLKRLDVELKHEICHWAAYYVSINYHHIHFYSVGCYLSLFKL